MREQPDFSSRPRPPRPPVAELALVVLGALALAFGAWSAWGARQGAAQARERVREARVQLASLESRMGSAARRSPADEALMARAAAASEVPPERVVADLAQVLPPDVRLQRLAIEYGDAVALDMQVVARDAEAWDRFLLRLEESASFENVVPGPERRTGEVRSVVKASFKRAPR